MEEEEERREASINMIKIMEKKCVEKVISLIAFQPLTTCLLVVCVHLCCAASKCVQGRINEWKVNKGVQGRETDKKGTHKKDKLLKLAIKTWIGK